MTAYENDIKIAVYEISYIIDKFKMTEYENDIKLPRLMKYHTKLITVIVWHKIALYKMTLYQNDIKTTTYIKYNNRFVFSAFPLC